MSIQKIQTITSTVTTELHKDGTVIQRSNEGCETRNYAPNGSARHTYDNINTVTDFRPDGSTVKKKTVTRSTEEVAPAARGSYRDIEEAKMAHFAGAPLPKRTAINVGIDPARGMYSSVSFPFNPHVPRDRKDRDSLVLADISAFNYRAPVREYRDPNPARTALADVLDVIASGLHAPSCPRLPGGR